MLSTRQQSSLDDDIGCFMLFFPREINRKSSDLSDQPETRLLTNRPKPRLLCLLRNRCVPVELVLKKARNPSESPVKERQSG